MIVHVGYFKTGTTYLQNNVFPFMEGVHYHDYEESKKIFKPVHTGTTFEFNAEQVAKSFDQREDSLYSYERLVGKMGVGTYNYQIAERLKKLGFKKIIFTIRRQDKIVESLYRQYIQEGGVLKPSSFVKDRRYFRTSHLDYYQLIVHYADLFGKENILIIPQEELRNNQAVALEKLREFCGAKAIHLDMQKKFGSRTNTSISYLSAHIMRIVNHFTKNEYKPSNLISGKITTWKFRFFFQSIIDRYLTPKSLKKKPLVKQSFKEKLLEEHVEENVHLQEEFDVNLEKYDYFEPQSSK